jgi:hypothetical protein
MRGHVAIAGPPAFAVFCMLPLASMESSMRALIWLAAASLFIAGCGQSATQLLNKSRSALEARIKAIDQFARKVESGEASATELKFPDGEKLRFISATAEGNTMVMHIEWALGSEPKFEFEYGEGVDLKHARESLAGDAVWDDADTARHCIDKLLKPRYLILVKVDKVTLPKSDPAEKSFTAGSVEFRVHAFDLNEMKELGAVSGTSTSSDKVQVRGKYFTDDQLKTDLAGNASLEFKKAIKWQS